jgi:rubredoxin
MQWVCSICGYLHDVDEEPPDICPVCGAPRGKFVESVGGDLDFDAEDEFGRPDEDSIEDLDDEG